ncbi:hypothetical protein Agub_g13490 [Astrephomene gubernaculifera]|uniref:Uncharacterized protein n=1 Tax=Astrephomene gubernaculifera TaxID=47775 RepID=A0AAD3E490_9CHLO|nr:hypothetical protein Agub_g13490 [Astrephomene gubernaculifera]
MLGGGNCSWTQLRPGVMLMALLTLSLLFAIPILREQTLQLHDKIPLSKRLEDAGRVALVVLGRADAYEVWLDLYLNMSTYPSVDLYYGTYDKPVRNCSDTRQQQVRKIFCTFLSNTTWTVGRNALARAVFRQQKAMDTVYKYWFFVDEDAWPSKCALCEGRDDLHSCCFDIFIEYLLRDTVNHASVGFASVAVQPEFRSPSGQLYFGAPFTQLFHDCVDSQIQAFHMQAVPLFIPYFDQLEDTSWWESQAFQFYIAAGCVPGATILLGGFSYVNEHYGHPDGRVKVEVEEAILQKTVPGIYDMLPHFGNSSQTGIQQGDCAGVGVQGWQNSSYVYHGHVDSGWWRKSQRYERCLATMKPRFVQYMQGR